MGYNWLSTLLSSSSSRVGPVGLRTVNWVRFLKYLTAKKMTTPMTNTSARIAAMIAPTQRG